MEIGEALKIMRALADGVNPETGEVLTADAVYQYLPVVRALHRSVRALEYVEERERSRQDAGGECGQVLVARRGRTGLRRAAPGH